MKPGFLLSILIMMLAVSCDTIGSLQPLTKNPSDLKYDPALAGRWEEMDSPGEVYVISGASDPSEKYYHCTILPKSKPDEDTLYFMVRLIHLSGLNYLDCWYNLEHEGNANKELENYNVPRHFFYKINIITQDTVELYTPDFEAIRNLVNNGNLDLQIANLSSLDSEEDYLVTSEPEELQKALKESEKYAAEVYKEKTTLIRVR